MKPLANKNLRDELIYYLGLCVDAFAHVDRKFENDMQERGNVLLKELKNEKEHTRRRT